MAPAQPVAAAPKTPPGSWTPMPLPDPTKIPPDEMQPPPTTSAAMTPVPTTVTAPSGNAVEQPSQPTNAVPMVESTPKTTDDDVVMTPINAPVSKEDKAKAKAEKAAAKAKAKQEADQAAADLKAKKEADRKAAKQKAADEAAANAQAKAKAKANAQQAAAELKAKKEAESAAKAQAGAQTAAPLPDNSDFFTPVPPPSNPGVQIGAQTAVPGTPPLSDQLQSNQQPVATPPPDVVAAPPAKPIAPVVAPAVKPFPANGGYPGKTMGFQPIAPPPLPVSAQKEAELQALLAKYMANQVSPDEYQKERAAILAEP